MKTHFMLSNFFPKILPFWDNVEKYIAVTEGAQMTSQYGAYALRAGLARLHARMCMHTSTRPGNHMHAGMHTQTNIQGGSNMTGAICV